MRALRFEKTGSLDFLLPAEVPPPVPAAGELLIKVEAAAVNPSDAKNVLGAMHETTLPRIPGRDFAGVVAQGPRPMDRKKGLWLGRQPRLWPGWEPCGICGRARGRGGGDAVLGWSFAQAAATGLSLSHGFGGDPARRPARARGDHPASLGTAGAVGSAAARLARRAGARVIGVVRQQADLSRASSLPVDAWIALDTTELAAGCRALTAGRGADVVFDTVGGPMFESCLAAVARRGRQVAIASGGLPRVTFNLIDFYHNETKLIGVDSLKWGFAETAQVAARARAGVRERRDSRPGGAAGSAGRRSRRLPADQRWHDARQGGPHAVGAGRPPVLC